MQKSMSNERTGDLVLSQGTFSFIQDGASGNVEVIVGPAKISLAESDKPVIYNKDKKIFEPCDKRSAIRTNPTADEGQYIVLTNPVNDDSKIHPSKGKQQTQKLSIGNKINIPGPSTFALFPEQHAKVIDGHQLKSNEYLLVRVYNEKAAKENLKNAIVKSVEGESESKTKGKTKANKTLFTEDDLFTGNLMVIRGTDVSFFIPPTGIEVVDNELGYYVRDAVTLERLEYCILLDQNGDKRYVQGPAVVFPKPTETFIESNSNKKFQAFELNDNMGIYVKVIANYEENGKKFKAGDEMFITGKEQKIYFPRPEHAMIKYGKRWIHYAVAIPEGEARYVLNKDTGSVSTIVGPKMYLPDPRTEVIVKRVLDINTCELWFPGNNEAIQYNLSLIGDIDPNSGFVNSMQERSSLKSMASTKTRGAAYAVGDEVYRSQNFTKPRTIQLDTKYEGAVNINVWPGYAVQIVKKSGERKIVTGPKNIILDYDETLEPLALSTGKPKKDHDLMKTVYLQISNNIVSDIVKADTKDMVNTNIRISYRVNFEEEFIKKWFNVSDYVKLLTQHMRSVIRNKVKKLTIKEFNENSTDIIRETVLGEIDKKTNKRSGKLFEENGMKIYDAEVLYVEIGDHEISQLLKEAEKDTVKHDLDLLNNKKKLEHKINIETIQRQILEEEAKTETVQRTIRIKQIEEEKEIELAELETEKEKQESLEIIKQKRLARVKAEQDQEIGYKTSLSNIEVNAAKEKLAAISPKLAEALTTMGNQHAIEILAKNLKAQNGSIGGLFHKGGIEGLLESVKGTPIYHNIKELLNSKKSE